jgi:hypothetical protein
VEHDEADAVARVLRADEVAEGEGDLLGGREAVLAVQDHAVRAVQHHDRRAGGLVFGLVDEQVLVVHVERDLQPLARERGEQGAADVEVQGVAELVFLRGAGGLDAGGEVARVVAPEGRLAQRAQKVAQRLVAQEVDALLRELELDGRPRGTEAAAALGGIAEGLALGHGEIALAHEALHDLVQELLARVAVVEQLLQVLVGESPCA